MPRYNAETCEHPYQRTKTERSSLGLPTGWRECQRCHARIGEGVEDCLKLSARVTVCHGDHVTISAVRPGLQRDSGTFLWSEPGTLGRYAVISTETGIRFAYPDRLKRKGGNAPHPASKRRSKAGR